MTLGSFFEQKSECFLYDATQRMLFGSGEEDF
jgi:hypothetical protein